MSHSSVPQRRISKSIPGDSLGRPRLAKLLVAEFPEHEIYVEPFGGVDSVLFAKPTSKVEVLGATGSVGEALRFARDATVDERKRLRRMKWVGDAATFDELSKQEPPKDRVARVHRFAYLAAFGPGGAMPAGASGKRSRAAEKLDRIGPRLKSVHLRTQDLAKLADGFDGPDTFFFLEPPAGVDAAAFVEQVGALKGMALVACDASGPLPAMLADAGLTIRKLRRLDSGGTAATTVVATNYDPDQVQAFLAGRTAKTMWGSPAGKKKIAARLVKMLPEHTTYVEPFVGSGAVLFEKDPVKTEVINDADPQIASAYRTLKRLTAKDIERLKRMKWTGDRAYFMGLLRMKKPPADPVERLHRFLYLTNFSYGRLRDSFNPNAQGVEASTMARVETFQPRLKNVRIFSGDYAKLIRRYDGPNTVFFLDPPYVGYNVDVGENVFDEQEFFDLLKSIKGRFLVTYGVRGKLPKMVRGESRFTVKMIRTPRYIRTMRGASDAKTPTQLVITNYKPTSKSVAELRKDGWEVTDVDKAQPFGTFGGSAKYARRLVELLPAHKTYVEPFAGAAAVLHVKEPAEKEVLSDANPDVVFLHRFIQNMDEATLEKLKKYDWTVTKESFTRAAEMKPTDDVGRFYQAVFLRTHGAYGKSKSNQPAQNHLGSTTNPEKYLRAAERLKGVTVLQQDYRKTIAKFDGPDTLFFLDPPYPGEWADAGDAVDLDEFVIACKGIRGKFVAVINDSAENQRAFEKLGHIFRIKISEASGTGGSKTATRLFVANFKVQKSNDVAPLGEASKATWSTAYVNELPDTAFLYVEQGGTKDADGKTTPRSLRHFPVRDHLGDLDPAHLRNAIARIPQSTAPGLDDDQKAKLQEEARRLLAEATKRPAPATQKSRGGDVVKFELRTRLIKNADPEDERYVLGIVLEPDTVDAQLDIYSADDVRAAAHLFMEDFGAIGLMHEWVVTGKVKILESYLAPVDFQIGDETVKAGTWLLAARILDDELWAAVKSGEITGWSIGGTAVRTPDAEADAAYNQETEGDDAAGDGGFAALSEAA